MTLPVPNLNARLVDVMGRLLPPWNSFFQQLVQPAPEVVSATSPYTANANGTLIISTPTTVNLIRGSVTIPLNSQKIIPISIGDTVTWSSSTAQFLGK